MKLWKAVGYREVIKCVLILTAAMSWCTYGECSRVMVIENIKQCAILKVLVGKCLIGPGISRSWLMPAKQASILTSWHSHFPFVRHDGLTKLSHVPTSPTVKQKATSTNYFRPSAVHLSVHPSFIRVGPLDMPGSSYQMPYIYQIKYTRRAKQLFAGVHDDLSARIKFALIEILCSNNQWA